MATDGTNGLWMQDYNIGYDAYLSGHLRDENAFQYDGPYRVGWFEASQGMARCVYNDGLRIERAEHDHAVPDAQTTASKRALRPERDGT